MIKISEYPIDQNLFLDMKWKVTDYYELCCKSELWGCAFLVSIDKQVTSIANEAIMCILERLVIESEGWDEKTQSNISSDFREFILAAGYISNDSGRNITIDEFWVNYEEIKNGICSELNFRITKNGGLTEEDSLIKKNEIVSAVCFADKWNNRQYFIESVEKWAFFSWATGA